MYTHTQRVRHSKWVLVIPAVSLFVAAWLQSDGFARTLLGVGGVLLLVLATTFLNLTVRDDGNHLLIHFGPVPLIRRRLQYSEIENATPGKTSWLDGWGIHMSPRGGWTWNLWGYDCVHVDLSGGRKMHIGTDDPNGLAEFLQSRIEK